MALVDSTIYESKGENTVDTPEHLTMVYIITMC